MVEHRMIATVDLSRFRDRGWQLVRSFGKDVMVSKPTTNLTDDERSAIRDSYNRFQRLSPREKARIRRNFDRFRDLPADRRPKCGTRTISPASP